MEQAQYRMLMRRRHFLKSNIQDWKNCISDSWEEKAFAEDASGHLGGCTWPPRSYSCSFCKREFRSAQALGGHMNVHRRDRARLKQSISNNSPYPNSDVYNHQYQNHSQTRHLKSFDSHFPSDVSTLDYDLDPVISSSSTVVSSTVTSRVSALSHQDKLNTSNSRLERVKNQKGEDSTCLTDNDFLETDLLIGFNSVLNRNPSTSPCGYISCKKPKTAVSAISFLIKPCSSDRYSLQPEVIDANSSSMEDIDLELRLGEPPKVK